VGLISYHCTVYARAARDTTAFLKAQVLVGLLIAVATAIVIGWASADVGETFNMRVAIYAAVVAAAAVGFLAFLWNLATAPWRMHEEQAARLREFERRPDVRRLVEFRERGVHLLNRPISLSEEQLADWLATLRAWEDETAAELEKCATKADVSEFRVLGIFTPRVFPGVTTVHNAEMTMLAERLERLTATIHRIEGGVVR
jgi:hypothetical protein